jgi:acyl carrier protein
MIRIATGLHDPSVAIMRKQESNRNPELIMTNESEIRRTVFNLLADVAPEIESEDDLDLAANLREQVDLDSMDFLNLITALSERFGVDIPEKDYGQLVCFNDFVQYFAARQSPADA